MPSGIGYGLAGELAAQQHLLSSIATLANAERDLAEAGLAPARARLKAAQAAQIEQELTQAEGLRQQLAGVSVDDPQRALMELASVAMRSGDVKGAAKALEAASAAQGHAFTQMKTLQDLRNQQITGAKARAELAGQLLGSVTDQKSFDFANLTWQALTGERSPLTGLPYSPELVKQVREMAVTEAKRQEIAATAARQDDLQRYREALLDLRKLGLDLRQQFFDLANRREDRLNNQGGRPSYPRALEVDQALRRLIDQHPDLGTPANYNVAKQIAYDAAGRAAEMMRTNPGLDPGAALDRVLGEMHRAGEVVIPVRGGLGLLPPKAHYFPRGQGRAPDKPLPLPTDASKLVPGAYYQNPVTGEIFVADDNRQLRQVQTTGGRIK